jgi:para-nitrobenzyl esterase
MIPRSSGAAAAIAAATVLACSPKASDSAPSPPAVAAPRSLEGTAWQLVGFEGGDGTRLTPDDPAKYTIEFAAGGKLAARLDCNRGRGTWKASDSSLEFGPMALTRAMCPPGSLHDRMVKHWPYVRSYLIRDGHLYLSLMADGGIYEFEPAGVSGPGGSSDPSSESAAPSPPTRTG